METDFIEIQIEKYGNPGFMKKETLKLLDDRY